MKQTENLEDEGAEHQGNLLFRSSRRHFLGTAAASLFLPNTPAKATLVQFPCREGLMNTYHLMRAGQSMLEEQNLLATNPLFLTNRENGLSDLGREQVLAACAYMNQNNINPSVVKFPLAANAMDTADLVANTLHVGRNRVVPEYTYLDQRGAGRFDMLPLQSTEEALWSLDVSEAGNNGFDGRPPPHDDGTPNETLGNQVTRLRQLLSLLETSLSGDEILLIFPDGTGPAVLSALIAGMPLNRAHEIQYSPGEIRLDVNYQSVRKLWPSEPSQEYLLAIQRGTKTLEQLRVRPEEIMNVRDAEYQRKTLLAEKEAAQKKEEAAMVAAERRRLQLERQEAREISEKKRFDEIEAERAARREQSQGDGPGVAELAVGSLMAGVALSKIQSDANEVRLVLKETQAAREEEAAADAKQEEETKTVESFDEIKTLEELVENASFELPEEARTTPERTSLPVEPVTNTNSAKEQARSRPSAEDIFEYKDTTDEWLDWMSSLLDEEESVHHN